MEPHARSLAEILDVGNAIRAQRYPDAVATFVAGSLIRGEGTAWSDIDLVVIRPTLPNAYRESFRFGGYPIETFVHDVATLEYFFREVDRPSGAPMLPQMVKEGIEVPEPTALSRSLKAMANAVIEMGPPSLSAEEDRDRRYDITNLLDDIRDPRSYHELIASAGRLYEILADYHLRANGKWSANGKSIPRVLERWDPSLAAKYRDGFERLFRQGDPSAVIALAEDIVRPNGGILFEGYRRDAPAQWRTPSASPLEI